MTAHDAAMRIAWFSPLPPVRSGIAAYSADLLPRLGSRRHAIDRLFPEADGARLRLEAAAPSLRSGRLSARQRALPRLHVGLPRRVSGPRRAARCAAAPRARRGSCSSRSGSTTTAASSGTTIRTRARDFVEYAVAGLGGPIYYFWSMLRVVMRTARLVAVHNPRVAADLREEFPGVAIERCIRHGRPQTARPERRRRARGACAPALGVPDDAVRVRGLRQGDGRETDRARSSAPSPRSSPRAPTCICCWPATRPTIRRSTEQLPASASRGASTSPATCQTRRSATTSRRPTPACACAGRPRWKRRRRGCSAWPPARPTVITDLAHLVDIPRSTRARGASHLVGRTGGDADRSAATKRRSLQRDARAAAIAVARPLARAGHAYWSAQPHVRDHGRRLPPRARRWPPHAAHRWPSDLPAHFADDHSAGCAIAHLGGSSRSRPTVSTRSRGMVQEATIELEVLRVDACDS